MQTKSNLIIEKTCKLITEISPHSSMNNQSNKKQDNKVINKNVSDNEKEKQKATIKLWIVETDKFHQTNKLMLKKDSVLQKQKKHKTVTHLKMLVILNVTYIWLK